jgi:integrase
VAGQFHKTRTPGVYFKQTSTGRSYYIDYKDDQGRRRREKVPGQETDAKNALGSILNKRVTGETIPGRVDVTYADYSRKVVDGREKSGALKPQSAKQYRYANESHAIPLLGHKQMNKITKHDILRVVQTMQEKGLASNTIRAVTRVMSVTFGEAQWEYGIPNHVRSLKREHLPKQKAVKPMRVYSAQEMLDLSAEAGRLGPRAHALILLALYSGLRISELAGLWWEDLDLHADIPTVTVRAQLSRRGMERLDYLKHKDEGEYRTVEIPRFVSKALAAWKLRSKHSGQNDYVFAGDYGGALGQEGMRAIFTTCRTEAGIVGGTFHDTRHTFASVLIAGGANIVEVQHALGHDKASTTLDTYSHLWGEQETRGRLRDILEAAAV